MPFCFECLKSKQLVWVKTMRPRKAHAKSFASRLGGGETNGFTIWFLNVIEPIGMLPNALTLFLLCD